MALSRWAAGILTLTSAVTLTAAATGTANASSDLFGAISISFETGRIASAVNYATQAEANRAANALCGRGCSVHVYFVNACGAVAEAPDDSVAWAWGADRAEAEQRAIGRLGLRAPRFPDLGSASPSAAQIRLWACTDAGGPFGPGGFTTPAP